MYVNFEEMRKFGLHSEDLLIIIAAKQRDQLILNAAPEDRLEFLKGNKYIEKKPTGKWEITDTGKRLLAHLETPNVNEEAIKTLDRMVAVYNKYGKKISETRKELEARISWFMAETGFKPDLIISKTDDYVFNSGDYTMSLGNFIWKPQSVAFSTQYRLRDSRLFDMIMNQLGFDPLPYLSPTRKKVMDWLMAVSRLPEPPVKANADILFTGSAKEDKERLRAIKQYFSNALKKAF